MNLKNTFLSAIAATAFVGVSSVAFAAEHVDFGTATPAWSGGKAVAQSDNSCFSEFYGGVRNTCASVKDWQMPLYSQLNFGYGNEPTSGTYDGTFGWVHIRATVGMICWLQGMNDSAAGGAGVWYGSTYTVGLGGTVNIPLNNTQFALNVTCRIPQNGVVTAARFGLDSTIS